MDWRWRRLPDVSRDRRHWNRKLLERKLLGRCIENKQTNFAPVTFIVHASKNDEVAITVRLRAVAAIAKAQSLSAEGWDVAIIGPDDVKYSPAEFDTLLSFSTP